MKLVQLVVALSIVYFLPVASSPEALLAPPFMLAVVAGALLFLVQPKISKREIGDHKSSDRHSAVTILLSGVLAHMLPVIEWQLRGFPWPTALQMVGVGLVIAGLWLRFYAIRVLGQFFTATVQVQGDHSLVTRGPYSKIRHPSYLGALAAITGHALLLGAPVSAVVVTVCMFFVYRYRIHIEEAALREGLGTSYLEYETHTSRLVPWLW